MKYAHAVVWYGAFSASLMVWSTAQASQKPAFEFPLHWGVSAMMAPVEAFGLNLNVYALEASVQDIKAWRAQHMSACRIHLTAGGQTTSWSLQHGEYADDWHCIDQDHIYSLLQRDGSYIWAEGTRVKRTGTSDGEPLSQFLRDAGSRLIGQSGTDVELVSIWSSKRSLYVLQRDITEFKQRRGARLLSQQVAAKGFTQSWQLAAQRTHITVQRSDRGDVILTATQGTSL